MEDEKLLMPVPSDVLLPLTVGPEVIPQHTPREVMAVPPSAVTFPPLMAVVDVRAETSVVVKVGAVTVTSFLQFKTKIRKSEARVNL